VLKQSNKKQQFVDIVTKIRQVKNYKKTAKKMPNKTLQGTSGQLGFTGFSLAANVTRRRGQVESAYEQQWDRKLQYCQQWCPADKSPENK
jgi:hypothetical protein